MRRLSQFTVLLSGAFLGRAKAPAKPSGTIALANEAESDAVIGLSNELAVASDGWVKIAPYGNSEKFRQVRDPDGKTRDEYYLQRLSKSAAETMVRESKSLLSRTGRALRFLRGIPIFRRHPDLTQHAPSTVSLENEGDKTPRGYFAELEAREDGFYGRPVISDDGVEVIANEGLKWLSPFWVVKRIGEEAGKIVVEPVRMISAGLTDRPNILGGEALANQRDKAGENQSTTMDRKLLCASLGLSETATDSDITAKINALKTGAENATSLANEKATLTTAEATAKTALANEQTAHTATRTTLGAVRKIAIDLAVGQALADGKISPAEKATWETALANESTFEAKLKELGGLKGKLPAGSITGADGGRKGENAGALAKFTALANECIKECGGDYAKGHATAKQRHPDAWKAVEAEEAARKGATAK